jgi:hypothetical protein
LTGIEHVAAMTACQFTMSMRHHVILLLAGIRTTEGKQFFSPLPTTLRNTYYLISTQNTEAAASSGTHIKDYKVSLPRPLTFLNHFV